MRLRFGRLSLPMLIFCAVIVGVIFYYFDNSSDTAVIDETPVSLAAAQTTQEAISQPIMASTPTVATRYTTSNRQDIPEDTKIFIPTANIWSDVIQAYLAGGNWDITNLRSNAGHLEGTAWVNQPGNTVISGHVELSSGLPGIFSRLTDLQIGDTIQIFSEGIEYTYTVTESYYTIPTDLEPLMPTINDRLTLITCNSYDIVTNAYQERLIIVAERVS
ncbi:MAG: sortase [Phototrophicaceae bacterium]